MLEDALYAKMAYLAARQNVVASNIANANTPNFISKDLKPFNLKHPEKRNNVKLSRTNTKHISGTRVKINYEVYSPHNTDVKLNGNDVDIQNESIKLNHNTLEYRKVTDMYSKIRTMMSIAIK